MRHATRSRRLARPKAHRKALLNNLVKNLVQHGHITTTVVRCKEAQRVAEKLVTYGKDGSIHARRQAFRVLQDRTLVKQLFGEIAPRFTEVNGGYTRVVRSRVRAGDGAQLAVLAFTKLPAVEDAVPPVAAEEEPKSQGAQTNDAAETDESKKGLFEGLREKFGRKKGSTGA